MKKIRVDKKDRVPSWKKIIDADRDFDWCFLLRLIVYKLKRMRNVFKYHGHHEGDEKIVQQMERVIELLERVSDEGDYHKAQAKKMKGKASFTALYRLEEKLKQKDLDEAFSIIAENVRCWWD